MKHLICKLKTKAAMAFTTAIFGRLTDQPKALRDEVNETTHRKKKSYLRSELTEVQSILKVTGRTTRFPMTRWNNPRKPRKATVSPRAAKPRTARFMCRVLDGLRITAVVVRVPLGIVMAILTSRLE